MTPYEILLQNESLLNQIVSDKSVPDSSTHFVNQIKQAYKDIYPDEYVDWNCSTCAFRAIKKIQRALLDYKTNVLTMNAYKFSK